MVLGSQAGVGKLEVSLYNTKIGSLADINKETYLILHLPL